MAKATIKPQSRCTHGRLSDRGEIRLPVLAEHGPRGVIRASKSGRRRAIVLAAVQLLIIGHVVLWLLSRQYGWWGGRTLTPVEPSESMEFVKHGVINAGLIFFVIALVSTLILGRWFCGWGCHIVMLQDLCGWIMKKCGVRPKAFRSRFLIYVPLLLALYMFVWPAIYRWMVAPYTQPDLSWPGFTTHLTTGDFWRTFPGLMVAIPFLFVCGFACVYFLGAKGFCTYGCPYGGFFRPLDRFAPGRILVTDACEQCGHCTAVCSSNVRVHEEVREYGMVVDPGCMKCLDCVSVCPNDALYFGFAKPAIVKGNAKNKKPKKIYDMTLGEEFVFAAVFALSFLAVRGVYGLVPMLMAAGIAGIVTFLSWKLWRLKRDPNVTMYRFQLKFKGSIRRAGWMFAALVVAVAAMTVHSGMVNAAYLVGGWYDGRVNIAPEVVFAGQRSLIPDEMVRDAERALKSYTFASSVPRGGIGLTNAWQTSIDLRRAWLLAVVGQIDEAKSVLQANVESNGTNTAVLRELALLTMFSGDVEQGIVLIRDAISQDPSDARLHYFLALGLADLGRLDDAVAAMERAVTLDTDDIVINRLLAELLSASGREAEAETYRQRVSELETAGTHRHQKFDPEEGSGTMNY